MSSDPALAARKEVHKTLRFCNFCTRRIAISFIDDMPSTFSEKLRMNAWYIFSIATLIGLVAGEFAFVILVGSSSVAEFVASLHIVGYGSIAVSKCIMLWLKLPVFRQVVNELVELWPVSTDDEEIAEVKRSSVTTLRVVQFSYVCWTLGGSSLYTIPITAKYIYQLFSGDANSDPVFIWAAVYPFDKTKPVYHDLVVIFEIFSGIIAVWGMLGSDLMFTAMASHISMLLRILQIKIRNLGHTNASSDNSDLEVGADEEQMNVDCYDDIVSVIKIHQRLISYCTDLEEVFSMVNLINVLISSVNICCVVFNIVLLEPWTEMSNKFFLGATLTQVGIICWYADDIFRASIGVADAVYGSGWYKSNIRCRRALLLLLQRSQKPLYFTALKFRSITMSTYSSILTTSYSYFTLLYTMYNGN